jgi:hypothetical protein
MFIRACRREFKSQSTVAVRFDLVQLARRGSKPRQEFVFGLGLLRQEGSLIDFRLFWRKALYRLARTDLSEDEQLSLICEMVGKGARLPTSAELDELARGWPGWMGWLSHNKLLKRAMERCAPVGSP